jgi:hypothetical protein
MSEANFHIATERHNCDIIVHFHLPSIEQFLRNCGSKHQMPERVESGRTANTAFQLHFARRRD